MHVSSNFSSLSYPINPTKLDDSNDLMSSEQLHLQFVMKCVTIVINTNISTTILDLDVFDENLYTNCGINENVL